MEHKKSKEAQEDAIYVLSLVTVLMNVRRRSQEDTQEDTRKDTQGSPRGAVRRKKTTPAAERQG